jgi:hypothetical protein
MPLARPDGTRPSAGVEVGLVRPCDMVRRMEERKFISAADMDRMTPNERAEAVNASICHSWDEVPEPFRSRVQARAVELGQRLTRGD